ncbi:hypothetical protein BGZ98_000749, partial [Dissophora globulifera]
PTASNPKGRSSGVMRWGLENSHVFFVAFQPGSSYCDYSYYPDIPVFTEAYAKVPQPKRCFFEQIREGHACNEYYVINRHIESDEVGEIRIVLLYQQVLHGPQLVCP